MSNAEHSENSREQNWETYERPAVMREFVREQADGTLIADLLVHGVTCATCTWSIETALNRMPGVVSIEVNPITTRAELHWDPGQIQLAKLLRTIADLKYRPMPFTDRATQNAAEENRRLALRRLLVAGLGMMQVSSYAVAMYAGAFQGMDPEIESFLRLISLIVATPIVIYSGAPFFRGAWRSVHTLHPGMDLPVAIAIGGAWLASVWNTFTGSGEVYFDSATMFVFFLSATRYLEAAGRYRALDLTHALAQQLPCTAIRLTTHGQEEVGVMELQGGDRVVVPAGIAFPADGLLRDETASVDESMLTGESLPVRRQCGDSIIAGTINTGERVTVEVQKTGPDTVLAQIGRLVTQAGRDRPQLVELTDRIASVFVSVIIAVALLTGLVWWQLDSERAFAIVLSVLVVTCPCALALATPAAFTVATSRLARDGFLVRRAGALQRLAGINRIVFDKTGTLTDNNLRISSISTTAGLDEDRAIALAAALEAGSAHPIARAFRSNVSEAATALRSVPGGGLQGIVKGHTYRIGNHRFVESLSDNDDTNSPLAGGDAKLRQVFLGGERGLAARIDLVENLRSGAAQMINKLKELGIGAVIASGDRQEAVHAMAQNLAADGEALHWEADMLPEDKLNLVRELQAQGLQVAAMGDGINDSPVLAGADVSIAMGSGTSIAQHSADTIWLGQQLSGLEQAFSVARKTMLIVKQNLAWALGYNLLAIPLAVTGNIEPWMAALGMSFSSLLVMLNALRLGKANDPGGPIAEPQADTDCRAGQQGATA